MHNYQAMQAYEAWKAKNDAGGRKKEKVVPSAATEAEWGVYRNEDGTLYLPANNLQRSMVEAGKLFKSPVRRMATMAREVAAGLFVPEDVEGFVLVDGNGVPFTDYEIDVRRAVVQRNGIQRARPRLREWYCEVRMQIDPVVLRLDVVLQILILAGRQVGVGDYRPERSGSFGRFKVLSFTDEVVVS